MTFSKVRVVRLAHVHYQHPNLDKALDFLQDFGMTVARNDGQTIYLRGYGTQPYVYIASQSPDSKRRFLGATWVVEDLAALETAANHPNAIPGGIKVSSAPGGGLTATIIDPLGNEVHFIHGQTIRSTSGSGIENSTLERDKLPANQAFEKTRTGQFRRFGQGPSPVHKLGHYGYMVPKAEFVRARDWYLSTLNLALSDTVYDPVSGQDETCFTHIDLGKEWTDHHSFFLASHPTSPKAHIHHASFEVNDFDTQLLGHHHLQSKAWTNCWGVGRHVLGSQIFDYWFDASGNILEHYSDGDLVNCSTAPTREPASPNTLFVWGPNVPLGFLTGRVEDAGVAAPMGGPPPVASEAEPAMKETNDDSRVVVTSPRNDEVVA